MPRAWIECQESEPRFKDRGRLVAPKGRSAAIRVLYELRPANRASNASTIGRCPLRIFTSASDRPNQPARSVSGNSAVRPERGGHSIVKLLLLNVFRSNSPSIAKA